MSLSLDHFFIITSPGAPQAKLLSNIGLVEGSSNDHPGQGTANRRFFLANSTIELIYLRDINEAQNGPGQQLHFAERSDNTSASPFGLVARAEQGATQMPFEGWRYYPDYFSKDWFFQIGQNSNTLEEPLCICMPLQLPRPKRQTENLDWYLTKISISVPTTQPSSILQHVTQCSDISLELNRPHQLELTFNNACQGKTVNLQSELPMVIHW